MRDQSSTQRAFTEARQSAERGSEIVLRPQNAASGPQADLGNLRIGEAGRAERALCRARDESRRSSHANGSLPAC